MTEFGSDAQDEGDDCTAGSDEATAIDEDKVISTGGEEEEGESDDGCVEGEVDGDCVEDEVASAGSPPPLLFFFLSSFKVLHCPEPIIRTPLNALSNNKCRLILLEPLGL